MAESACLNEWMGQQEGEISEVLLIMQKMVIAAIAIPVAAALGFGCYEMSKQSNANTALQNQQPAPGSPQYLASPPSQSALTPGTATPQATTTTQTAVAPGGLVPGGSTTQAVRVVPGNQMVVAPAGTNQSMTTTSSTSTLNPTSQPQLYAQQPVAAVPPAVSQTTIEKETVVTPTRTVYKKVYVTKHHKSGKVHVARATKHGAMFALKLPGRLAF